jgi:large subunit ribosomal protein L15
MKNLPKIKTKGQKRVGRGYGSGKGGHTSGRGMKGQKARGKVGVLFEGMKMKKSLIKRLPLRRGKGKFKSKPKPLIIKIDYLNLFTAGTKVDIGALIKQGIVAEKDAREFGVKILGGKELKKKLAIAVPTSKSAAKAVIKMGGTVDIKNSEKDTVSKTQKKSKKE